MMVAIGLTLAVLGVSPTSVVLVVLVIELNAVVTGESGVLAPDVPMSKPIVLTVEVTGASAPLNAGLPVTAVLMELVTVLRAPPSGLNGVPPVVPPKPAPTLLSADVSGGTTPISLPLPEPA